MYDKMSEGCLGSVSVFHSSLERAVSLERAHKVRLKVSVKREDLLTPRSSVYCEIYGKIEPPPTVGEAMLNLHDAPQRDPLLTASDAVPVDQRILSERDLCKKAVQPEH